MVVASASETLHNHQRERSLTFISADEKRFLVGESLKEVPWEKPRNAKSPISYLKIKTKIHAY